MGTYLGIDFGDKRVGLALSDPEKKLARRFVTLNNSSGLVTELEEVIRNENVERIIMGIPLAARGETEQTKKVRKFISDFQKEVDIPIEGMNEIMTSKMARENLIGSGVKDIKAVLDQEAARIILQDYLDFQKK